ncbi:hypothetical protein WUBG_02535 [Wuchereria bancrofti]|uniref:Uncharacterized protein n=2 Tax=Wuchereria bancrofti TaxID=6293 RepID=J9BGY9_WUCBA|nr:hypothetical protein WUBG_02535 [Wuchereria bancrofti]VDM15266.1 unnamed protein product [Wuchereria bancrofti]
MDSTYSPQIMIRSVSIIIVWIFVVEASRIIFHSGSTDADRGNGSEKEKWINEMDNGDYNDDDDGDDDDNNNNNDYEAFTNENTEDSDIHKDKINEWKSSDNDKENLINDESRNDNNIVTEIITNNSNGNENNGENVSKKEDDEIDKFEELLSSTKEANIIDYSHNISSAPKDHILMEKGMIDVVIKKNVKRVKHASKAGNSRKVKVMQERRNNRLDSSNTSENWNHHKHKVTES